MPTPLIVAHRGASREAPENTLAAFERALALGADGIELDVHATADGVVVVHHDPHLPHTDGAPALVGRAISDLPHTDLAAVTLDGGHAIPTLAEVLELVGARLTVFCELKGARVVEHAAPLLAAHDGPCAMHAFDHRAVHRAAELAPAVPRGILVVGRLADTSHALTGAHATTLWPQHEYIDEDLVAETHAASRTIVAWTVNDPNDMRRLAAMGVDALCTDDVAAAHAALRPTFDRGHA